jgi:hypothetical protein
MIWPVVAPDPALASAAGCSGSPGARLEPARWALGFEVSELFAVELGGELVQWLHLISPGLSSSVVWYGSAGRRRSGDHDRGGR